MAPRYRRSELHPHILVVMEETDEEDPFLAVRKKARDVVSEFHATLGGEPPFNAKAIASIRGLHWSEDDPRFSLDSEIAPEADGRVVLRVNKNRPATRQRFSICHEVGHTLFPEYELAVRCRKAVERTFADPEDLLETLCDVAASELMFPLPWFGERIRAMKLSADAISRLATDYVGSPEATIRRLVELHPEPLVAVFFSWKLKPTEARAMKRMKGIKSLFPDIPLSLPSPMLRVDYAITNEAFETSFADHIPKDKSVPNEGPIHAASVSHTGQDGEAELDLGTLRGRFQVHAVPIFTPDGTDEIGSAVAAVLRPTRAKRR